MVDTRDIDWSGIGVRATSRATTPLPSRPRGSRTSNLCNQRITLREVAAAAGVSAMTVSNVLLGRLGRVSADTRARIEREINRLGYRPHSAARGLRTAEWRSIGMLVADDAPTFLAGGFMTNLVAGLSNYLSARDYALLLQGVSVNAFSDALLIKDIRTDGICSFLSGTDSFRRASH